MLLKFSQPYNAALVLTALQCCPMLLTLQFYQSSTKLILLPHIDNYIMFP